MLSQGRQMTAGKTDGCNVFGAEVTLRDEAIPGFGVCLAGSVAKQLGGVLAAR